MNRLCVILLSIAIGIVWGVAAGLLAGFGLIENYFSTVLFILVLSALVLLGYKAVGYLCPTSRIPLILSGISVIVNSLVLGLIGGTLVDVAVAIGFIFGIGFAVFAAMIIAMILTR